MMPHKPSAHPDFDQNAYKWKALATVALGTTMATMDIGICNISFPVLIRVFHTDLSTVMWVSLAYSLVSSSLLLTLGRISDLLGRKKIYTAGMAFFVLGLLACSLAQNIYQLIIFRMVQAVGPAIALSCGTAIVTEAFPPQERGKGIGLHSMSVSIGFITGPILGGFLLNWLDWRSIFYVRFPFGLLALIMVFFLLKKDQTPAGKTTLDIAGTLSSAAGLAALIFGVSRIEKWGLNSTLLYLIIGSGLLMLVVFVFVERHAKNPIVDLSLFKNRPFSCASWSLFLVSATYPAYTMIVPIYLMHGEGMSPSSTGVLMAVASMTTIVVSPVSGWLSDRFGPARFATFGTLANLVFLYLMLQFEHGTTLTAIVTAMIALGVGIGAFHAPNSNAMMGSISGNRLGSVSALIATKRHMGISLGMAIAGSVFTARRPVYRSELMGQGLDAGRVDILSIPPAFHDVLLMIIPIGILAALLAFASGLREKGSGSRALKPTEGKR